MKTTKVKAGVWVRVTWHDACDEKQTWMRDAEIDEGVVVVVSGGYLLRKSTLYYTLAGDKTGTQDEPVYGRITRIPVKMVQKVVVDA